MLHSILVVKL